MALTSASSIAEIMAAYIDNAMYDVNGSLAQAKLFVQAARILLLVMPKMAASQAASLSLSPEIVQGELENARRFIALTPDPASATGGGTRHFSFSDLRDRGN